MQRILHLGRVPDPWVAVAGRDQTSIGVRIGNNERHNRAAQATRTRRLSGCVTSMDWLLTRSRRVNVSGTGVDVPGGCPSRHDDALGTPRVSLAGRTGRRSAWSDAGPSPPHAGGVRGEPLTRDHGGGRLHERPEMGSRRYMTHTCNNAR
jgi:hypothetical protein